MTEHKNFYNLFYVKCIRVAGLRVFASARQRSCSSRCKCAVIGLHTRLQFKFTDFVCTLQFHRFRNYRELSCLLSQAFYRCPVSLVSNKQARITMSVNSNTMSQYLDNDTVVTHCLLLWPLDKARFLRENAVQIDFTSLWLHCHSLSEYSVCRNLLDVIGTHFLGLLDFVRLYQLKLRAQSDSLNFWTDYVYLMKLHNLYDHEFEICANVLNLPEHDPFATSHNSDQSYESSVESWSSAQ